MKISKLPVALKRGESFRIGPDIFKVIFTFKRWALYKRMFTQLHYCRKSGSWVEDERTGTHVHPAIG